MRAWRSTLTTRPRGHRDVRSLLGTLTGGAAGVGFGLLTWTIAHIATLAAFAHIHPGFVIHYHSWVGPLAIAALMLTVTSLAAVTHTLLRPPPVSGARLSAVNGALAPAAFVAVEFAEYFAGVHEAPPAALLVIGCALHAVLGVASPRLWLLCLDTVARHAVATPFSGPLHAAARLRIVPVTRIWVTGSGRVIQGERAPPAGRGSTAPAAC